MSRFLRRPRPPDKSLGEPLTGSSPPEKLGDAAAARQFAGVANDGA